MQGRHYACRSIPISVCSFTLMGNSAAICDCNESGFSGPFVTYLREDDDYLSLAKRLGMITGDAEWEAYRLAVVVKFVPFFLNRKSSTPAVSLANAASNNRTSPSNVTADTPGEETEHESTAGGDSSAESGADLPFSAPRQRVLPPTVYGPQPSPNPSPSVNTNNTRESTVRSGEIWQMVMTKFPFYKIQIDNLVEWQKKCRANNSNIGAYPIIGIQRSVADLGNNNKNR